MSSLVEQVRIWNTPILGSYLLWRFRHCYTSNHPDGEAPIILLHFMATAILTDQRLTKPISRNRKGLQSYSRSFTENKDIDVFLSLQNRIITHRNYTFSSIDIAIRYGLLTLNPDDARLYPHTQLPRPKRGNALKPSIKSLGERAETLGNWFSQHEISQIAALLKVVL